MSRARRIVAGLVGGAAAVALLAGATWEGVRRYRPPLAPGQAYGIDVSRHQGTIDWKAVAGHGVEYAYIKATEGTTLVDPQFARNWEASGAAGIRRGAYHFFSLCSRGEGQLANVLETVPVDDAALPPALDLEFGTCDERPPPETVARDLDVLVRGIEEAWGRPVVVYVLPEFAAAYPAAGDLDRPQWVRRILREPDRSWEIWQVSGFARVEGVDGGVDLNVWARRDEG